MKKVYADFSKHVLMVAHDEIRGFAQYQRERRSDHGKETIWYQVPPEKVPFAIEHGARYCVDRASE